MSIHPNKAHFYAIFTGRTAVKQRLQSTGQRRRWQLGDHLGGEWTGRRGRRSSSSMTPTLCAAVVSSSHVSINRSRLTRAIYLSISSCVVWCCRCELPCRARRWGSFHRCRQWQGQLEKVMRRAGWTNGQREKTKDWPVFGGWFTAQAPDRKRVIYLESSPPPNPPLAIRLLGILSSPLIAGNTSFLPVNSTYGRLISSFSVLRSKQVWQVWNKKNILQRLNVSDNELS